MVGETAVVETAVAVSNNYEVSARMLKAHKLYAHLQARGIKSEHLQNMHPQILAHHIASAGVNDPSEETLGMVHQMLQGHERAKANAPADPFEGLS